MDRFELIVLDRETDQRIEISCLVNEALPIGKLGAEQVFAYGGGVDDVAGCLVGQRRARYLADFGVVAFDDAACLDCQSRRDWVLVQIAVPLIKCISVT